MKKLIHLIKFFFLATFNTVLPLAYYDILSDQISKKDDNLAEYTSAANNFFNNEVQNPNTYNKHNSYTLTMVTRLPQADQDFINEVITNNVEKLQWDPVEIARHLKVKIGTFVNNENNKLNYYLLKIKIVTFSQIELDKKLGCIWHAIVGEEFGYEITYEVLSFLLIFSLILIYYRAL